MRKLFTLVLIALLLGVGIVAIIETDPGYVLVSYGNISMETSLWVGLLLLALLVVVIYLVFRLVYRLIGGQRFLTSWLGTRKTKQAVRHSTRGLISFTEGNWDKARRQLLRGAQKNDAPLFNYFLAARASDKLQEPEQVQEYLRAAVDTDSAVAVAVEITLAEMKLQAGDYEQASASLVQARKNIGRHPYVLGLLRQIYQGMGDWDGLLKLLPDLKKHKQLSNDAFLALERDIHSHRLAQSASDPAAADTLPATWQKVPSHLKRETDFVNMYVSQLVDAGASDAAEKIILRSVKQQWDSGLVRQYGLIEGGDTTAQLAQAERWLVDHTEDAELLLCLGRLSSRNKLWGKARDYFESSYRVQNSAEICAELGRLLSELGEPAVAAAYFREGLLKRESELPQLPMPDKVVTHGKLAAG